MAPANLVGEVNTMVDIEGSQTSRYVGSGFVGGLVVGIGGQEPHFISSPGGLVIVWGCLAQPGSSSPGGTQAAGYVSEEA